MAFQLKPDESVNKGIRRLARREMEKCLDLLTGKAPDPPEEAVHDVRKRFKKIRGLLRLAREGLGEAVFRQEKTCFRDAGRPLSEVRDAKVLLDTFDELTDKEDERLPRQAVARLRRVLVERQQEVSRRVLEGGALFDRLAAVVAAARERVADWPRLKNSWATLAPGLKRVYKQGRNAMRAVQDQPTIEALHEWRKRVKDLWHQLQVLQPVWRWRLEDLTNQTHELGDRLGDDHDRAVLADFLLQHGEDEHARDSATRLLRVIRRRRVRLQQAALELGGQVFRERPRAFVDSFKPHWREWQAEGKLARAQ
jgi:CHAD domain-containing protein